ncbi:hypothetical protein [Streptomyces collinus]|uniref:hypothetical protein n=1 Tax=Streptomyces collinus TaxID=42684 RepID=UPI0036E67BE3
MHGSTELTGDLELLWDGTPNEAHALREALAQCSCIGLYDLDRSHVGYRVTGASGDLCTPALPWGAMDVIPYLTSAKTTRDPAGFTIRYAALDDLIACGRPPATRRTTAAPTNSPGYAPDSS